MGRFAKDGAIKSLVFDLGITLWPDWAGVEAKEAPAAHDAVMQGTHDHKHLPHGFWPWETLLGRVGVTTAVCDIQALRSEQFQHTLLHSSSRQSWSPQWGRRSCLGSALQAIGKAFCLFFFLCTDHSLRLVQPDTNLRGAQIPVGFAWCVPGSRSDRS